MYTCRGVFYYFNFIPNNLIPSLDNTMFGNFLPLLLGIFTHLVCLFVLDLHSLALSLFLTSSFPAATEKPKSHPFYSSY